MNWVLRRSDVATREIPNGHDLSVALAKVTDHAHRVMVLDATAKLLRSLTQAGAFHQDLNLKNVLLTAGQGPELDAHVLDVDRVLGERLSLPEQQLYEMLLQLDIDQTVGAGLEAGEQLDILAVVDLEKGDAGAAAVLLWQGEILIEAHLVVPEMLRFGQVGNVEGDVGNAGDLRARG